MNLGIYTILDTKAQAYMRPWYARSNGEAVRSFIDSVNDDPSKSDLARHPEDYVLFRIGEFNQLTGEIVVQVPESLGVGVNFLRKES